MGAIGAGEAFRWNFRLFLKLVSRGQANKPNDNAVEWKQRGTHTMLIVKRDMGCIARRPNRPPFPY